MQITNSTIVYSCRPCICTARCSSLSLSQYFFTCVPKIFGKWKLEVGQSKGFRIYNQSSISVFVNIEKWASCFLLLYFRSAVGFEINAFKKKATYCYQGQPRVFLILFLFLKVLAKLWGSKGSILALGLRHCMLFTLKHHRARRNTASLRTLPFHSCKLCFFYCAQFIMLIFWLKFQ